MNEKEIEKIEEEEALSIVPIRDYKAEIIELLRSSLSPKTLREELIDYHESDIADAIDEVEYSERKKLYSIFDAQTLSEIFEYTDERNSYINELNTGRKISILSHIEPSLAVEYLDSLDSEEEKEKILGLMDSETKSEVRLLSSFDEDEIGSRMTTNYITIKKGSSIKEAMSSLIEEAAENDNINTLYVVDEGGIFCGAVDLKDLIIARKDCDLENITMTSYPYVYASEQIDECIERIKSYSEDSIPALDYSGKLLGVLISQDVIELIDDEMSDDYAKLAGLSAEEDLNEPLIRSIGKRLPWLAILLGLGLLVSSVVGAFEHVVAHLTLIVCFQSLILGMAGNAGTQSLAVTIRVLMDENLSKKQKLLLVGKEARIGLINGVILGALSFLFIGLYIMLFKGYDASYSFSVSLCTGIALTASIILSSIVGTVIPLIFKKIKVDPAVASGPLITTVNDLVAVLSYYGLAWVLLINILGL